MVMNASHHAGGSWARTCRGDYCPDARSTYYRGVPPIRSHGPSPLLPIEQERARVRRRLAREQARALMLEAFG